ncbi:hypothetical protein BRADI_2g55450v3 [Brachypodium distachyon]|uniref:Uncharacterized protein n=1 Tax=Brachypodium distachyon TaxID=15368 RepID=A0A0Q3JE20_BRADI|nr:hypothetical protein BRADI_2g55450v3 [Brachypodium distachyon]
MAAEAAMTVDFLRARLLSERSVSRASKERADQLAAKVAELEEQVLAVTAQRQQAERETDEVLAILESRGFSGSQLSEVLDSGSDNDEEELRDTKANGDVASSHGEVEPEQEPAAQREAEEDAQPEPEPGGLSWKGRSVSPRKARQLKQRHRRSYFYLLASEPDPSRCKYRMGQSCRKNKRTELRSPAPVVVEDGTGLAVSAESRKGKQQQDDERDDDLDGEVGGDERSSGDGRGQYVIRCRKDGEMERVLEKQAELIGQFEAEEKAQRDWEKQFNDNRRSPKGDVKAAAYRLDSGRGQSNRRSSKVEEQEASSQVQANSSGKSLPCSKQPESTATRRNQDEQGDANSDACSSYSINARPSRHRAMVKSSSESTDTRISKVSDWSSSRFHDHSHTDGRQLMDTRLDRQPSNNDIDVESVLQALQRAKISLTKKLLSKPLPPSQVTLALPAPGDEYRTEEDFYDGNDSYRGEEHSGSSPSRQEILALPAPEDHRTDFSSFAEKSISSSPPRQEILALPAPGDDCSGEREDVSDLKILMSSPGLLRLPTDSFPPDEMLSTSNGHDSELGLRETARYDPHGSATLALPNSGKCNVPSSAFSVGSAASFLSGVPELPEDLRRGRKPLADVNSFMQRGCDYTVSNKWML